MVHQTIDHRIQEALSHHQKGDLLAAKALYEQVLSLDPEHPDALHLLGVIAHQTQRHALSIELITRALQADNERPSFWNNKGIALQALDKYEEALYCFENALKLEIDYAAAYNNKGNALRALNRHAEAAQSFIEATKRDPNYAEAYNNLGVVYRETNEYPNAVTSLDRAIAIKANYADAHYNKGQVLSDLKNYLGALDSYNASLALNKNNADAWNNRGVALEKLGYKEEALGSFNQALQIRPAFAEALNNQANILINKNQYMDALASIEKAIALQPDYFEAHTGRAFIMNEMGRFHESLESFEHAIKINPLSPEPHNSRGTLLHDLGRFDDALNSYDQAIGLREDYHEAVCNKSIALLQAGNYAKGWELFESRWKNKDNGLTLRYSEEKRWKGGDNLRGKIILLHAEQGLGDTLQFCRYAIMLSELGARVILEVQKPLVGLMNTLAGAHQVVEQGLPVPHFDFHCPLMSLPLRFKTTIQTIPSPTAYLASSQVKVSEWRQRLGLRTKPRIGLAWSGNPAYKGDETRSLLLKEILEYLPENCEYICLQKEVRDRDSAVLAQSSIRFFDKEHIDFSDSAAICDLVDLIVTSDTSVAHLAGALGRPTWVMLKHVPDWRWLREGENSPWYESVRLFRQRADRQWKPVLAKIAAQLRALEDCPAETAGINSILLTAMGSRNY